MKSWTLRSAAAHWLRMGLFSVMSVTAAAAAPGAFTVLHTFDDFDGTFPMTPLTLGSDGDLYGSSLGEDYNDGTLYRMARDGSGFMVLHTFTGDDGSFPESPLVEGPDGNFYGTTAFGGPSDAGTVFMMTPQGVLTTLHAFSYGDGYWVDDLILGRDGSSYGTTHQGGANNAGVVFRITPTGAFSVLHDFTGADGSDPQGLVQARNGAFYGSTYYGGTGKNYGTIFGITAAGKFASLYSFDGFAADGIYPTGALATDADGNLYGTTNFSTGALDGGSVFKFTPARQLTTLHTFASGGYGGVYPNSGVILGPGGVLLGTALEGGALGGGTVFELFPSGRLTALHAFSGNADGLSPAASLLRIGAKLFGTTSGGASTGAGTIFELTY